VPISTMQRAIISPEREPRRDRLLSKSTLNPS